MRAEVRYEYDRCPHHFKRQLVEALKKMGVERIEHMKKRQLYAIWYKYQRRADEQKV